MTVYYSPKMRSFYDPDVGYKTMPDDIVELTREEYQDLLVRQHNQEGDIVMEDGRPVIRQVAQYVTWEQIRIKRQRLLKATDHTDLLSFKSREGVKVFNAWQKYRQALRDVTKDFLKPEDVIWPEQPTFQ